MEGAHSPIPQPVRRAAFRSHFSHGTPPSAPGIMRRTPASRKAKKPGLSEEQIEEIREAFNLFDTDTLAPSTTAS